MRELERRLSRSVVFHESLPFDCYSRLNLEPMVCELDFRFREHAGFAIHVRKREG